MNEFDTLYSLIWGTKGGIGWSEVRTSESHTGWVYAVSLSSDGKRAISGSGDRTLILWDVESGKVLHRLYTEGSITSLSQLGDKVVFGDWEGRVQFSQILV
jgi:WD40 repeat protein